MVSRVENEFKASAYVHPRETQALTRDLVIDLMRKYRKAGVSVYELVGFLVSRAEKESKGFGKSAAAAEAAAPKKAKAMSKQDLKWQLQPYDVPEWIEWVDAQKIEAGVTGARRRWAGC